MGTVLSETRKKEKKEEPALQFATELEQSFLVATSTILDLLQRADAASSTIVSHTISKDVALRFALEHGDNEASKNPNLVNRTRVRLTINDVDAERVLSFKTERDIDCPYKRGELNIPIQRSDFESLVAAGERGRLVEERFPLAGTIHLGSVTTPITAEIDILLGAGRKLDIEAVLRKNNVVLPPFVCVDVEVPTPEHRIALLEGNHSFDFLKDPSTAIPVQIGDGSTKEQKRLRVLLSHKRLAKEGLSKKDLAFLCMMLDIDPPKEEGKKRFPWIHKDAPSLVWNTNS